MEIQSIYSLLQLLELLVIISLSLSHIDPITEVLVVIQY